MWEQKRFSILADLGVILLNILQIFGLLGPVIQRGREGKEEGERND